MINLTYKDFMKLIKQKRLFRILKKNPILEEDSFFNLSINRVPSDIQLSHQQYRMG